MENSNNIDRLQALLKIYSIKEIVSIFYNIDTKLLSLHNCSSEDFLNLGAILKQQHSRAKLLSEQSNEKLQEFKNFEANQLFKDLILFHNMMVNKTNSFDKKISAVIQNFEKTINQLEFLIVPLQNFKQNLITLKLLVTNLKLSISYHQSGQRTETEDDEKFLDELIEQTKAAYASVDDNLLLLKGAIKSNYTLFKKISDDYLQAIKKQNFQILKLIQSLESKHNNAIENLTQLTVMAENCFKNINEIITNLQYQDIISQKMSHVQQSYKSLLDGLDGVDENEVDNNIAIEQVEKLLQIPDVAELQVAQLIITNKEYQSAIENITKKTIEISETINTMAALSMPATLEDNLSQNEASEIISAYTAISQHYSNIYKIKKTAQKDFDIITKAVNFLTDNITNISNVDEKLDLLPKKAKEIFLKYGKSTNEFNSILTQIANITLEVRIIKENVHNIFDQLLLNIKAIKSELNKMFSEDWFFDSLLENFQDVVPNLNKSILLLNDSRLKNEKLIFDSLENFNLSLFKVKYYDFFETVMEEVINELNTINCKIRLNTPSVDLETKEKNLKHIELLYSMQSERNIHEQISKGNMMSNNSLYKDFLEKKNNNSDDIEFF